MTRSTADQLLDGRIGVGDLRPVRLARDGTDVGEEPLGGHPARPLGERDGEPEEIGVDRRAAREGLRGASPGVGITRAVHEGRTRQSAWALRG